MIALLVAAALAAAKDEDSAYEKTLIDWALKQHQVVIEPNPGGKVIDDVLTAREDVFSESDPLTWPRIFHGKTREHVVLREVLLKRGDEWSRAKADETERNLRGLVAIAVAKVIPVKSPLGGVIVLVVTKDRWSFRANWDYVVVGDVLERLHVPLTEVNLLGEGIEVTVDPYLRRDTFSFGEEIIWRRFLDSPFLVRESLGLVFHRYVPADPAQRSSALKKLEGTYGILQFALPLANLEQKWGFNVFAVWDVRRVRIFRGRNVWELGYPDDEHPVTTVPYVYDARVADVAALGMRQFGGEWKSQVTAGVAGYVRQYRPPPESFLGTDPLQPDVASWFSSTKMPRSEDAAYLYGEYRFFRARYLQKHDLETFGLTEDFQVGPRVIVAAKWAVPVIAPSSYVELGATLRWRFFFADDLLTISAGAAARWQVGGYIVNEHYAFEVANWSPQLEGGRFVTRVLGEFRGRDLDNNQFVLGAGAGLRGTPSGALVGSNMVLGNFEYRTRPFNILTLLAGFVVFYDVGTAFDLEDRPTLTHTAGVGLRILVPQLNTVTIRVDLGFIIGSPDSELSVDRLSSTFGQVTQLRPSFFDDPL